MGVRVVAAGSPVTGQTRRVTLYPLVLKPRARARDSTTPHIEMVCKRSELILPA